MEAIDMTAFKKETEMLLSRLIQKRQDMRLLYDAEMRQLEEDIRTIEKIGARLRVVE